MRIGFHVMIAGGLAAAVERALATRCQTLQIFASAPSQWKARTSDAEENAAFVRDCARHRLHPLFVHAPYLLNLASPDAVLVARSRERLVFDLQMAQAWGAEGVVLHLGSGGPETPREAALERLAASLRAVLDRVPPPARLLLENSAGQGSVLGHTPHELGRIVELVGRERLGLVLDTAHAFAAGYPLHTPRGLESLLDELDEAVGLDLLALVHANDVRGALGSHHDRHWHIGLGGIGREGWRVILAEPRLQHLPFIMETPKDPRTAVEDDLRNLRALRRLVPAELRPPLPRLRRGRQ